MKLIESIASLWGKIREDKRLLSGTIALGIVVLGVGGYFGYQHFHQRFAIPTVSGANFSFEYRKIPYDTKSIDITFSTDIDPTSLNTKNVTLAPFVEGKSEVKHGNTISYVLDKKLQIGEIYTFTIASDIRSKYGNELGEDQIFTIEAIAGAQATKILPSGKLDNLGQSIIVLFNIPVVPMTNLDERDMLPCPLTITPKVEGKCKWTAGNILEFVPSKPLESATKYHLSVTNIPGLLYTLAGTLKETIITPALEAKVATDPFDPKLGISLTTTAPVDPKELAKNLELSSDNKSMSADVRPVLNDDKTESETRFTIIAKSPSFLYSKTYALTVKKGLKPKYGTEPLAADFTVTAPSRDFLTYSEVIRQIYDASGALSDTKTYDKESHYEYIPSKNAYFRQTFAADVGIDKNLFTLRTKAGKILDFDVAYVKQTKYDDHGNDIGEEDNRQMIDIQPKTPLEYATDYELIINKKADSAIPSDIIKTYRTAPKLQVLGHTFLSNTETCIYVNTKLSSSNEMYAADYDKIRTVPTSTIHDLMLDEKTDYTTNIKTYRCVQKKGQVSYILGTRLEPLKDYTIVIPKNIEDVYGNHPDQDTSFPIKTGVIDPKDIYLYSSLSRDTQIIPDNLPIVLNLMSINADRANLEVCEMNTEEYLKYLEIPKNLYTPKCTRNIAKSVILKNQYWKLTPNKIDVIGDMLGGAAQSPFIFVRGSTGKFNQGAGGYMDDQREFAHMFIRSNLALTLENAANTKILFAPSFDGKTLPDNLTFETYTYKNGTPELEPIALKITWNAVKKYYELSDKENKLALIVAHNDRSFGVLNTSMDQVSNYDFKYISGQESSTKDYLYMYSDRPLYKAGDTVFFKGLLRQFRYNGYYPSPTKTGKLKVVDENETVLYETDIKLDHNSNFNGTFVLPKKMSLGHYRFDFYAGTELTPVYTNGEFDVSAYKKPTFKVSIAADKTNASIGDQAKLNANAEYYFGGRLVNADYTYSILSQSYFFNAKDYADYQFGKGSDYFDCVYWGSCAYGDNLVMSATGRLDDKGEASLAYDYPKTDDADHTIGERIYTYTLEITDPDTAKTVSNQTSQILHTTDAYVGIKVPYYQQKKDGIKMDGIVLDYDAKGLDNKDITLELWRHEIKEVKKQGVDGTFYNESSIEEIKETTKKVTSNNKGEFNSAFAPIKEGEYEIRAMYTGANKQTFLSSSILYVSGEKNTYWNEGNNSVTDLIADKSIAKIGETVGFTLKSPVTSGKMLVTIEKDDGVLDSFVRDIKGTSERIEVSLKDAYVPNIYVKVFLIGQDAGMKLPIYKRALAVVKVTTDPKKLSVTITPEKKQYLPGQKVKLTVSVKDSAGRPVALANGSLSLVDESLLALAGNPLKNPFAFFYDMKRYLGIETYISLVNLIERLEVKDTSLGEKGGAGEGQKGGTSRQKRGIFKDTAYWQADFTTDKNGNYTILTDALPDNLTTWVIEALVSTPIDNRVGLGTTTVMTAKTVMISENLPRFLGEGDEITFSPVIFNKTGKNQSFDITINGTNLTIDSTKRTAFIKSGESYTVPFKATVNGIEANSNEPIAAKITFKAVAKESGELDEVENTLPIIQTTTPETVATAGKTADSADERINLSTNIRKNGGSVTLKYAASLLPNILSGMEYLKTFPYGCSEQRTSAIMPTIYLKQLYDSIKVPFDFKTKMVGEYIDRYQGFQQRSLDTILRGYLVEVKNFQRLDGGFGFWMDSMNSDFPLTISLVSALSDIRSIGYTPNDIMMANAVKYLKAEFYANKQTHCIASKDVSCAWPLATRLKTIEAILDNDSQDYEAYKMYKLLTFKNSDNLSMVNQARVLAKLMRINTIAKTEKDALKKTLDDQVKHLASNALVYNPRGAFLSSIGEGSRLEVTTRFIETLALMGPTTMKEYEQIMDNMERWIISEKKKDGSFGSTADTSNVIRSLAHVMRASGELRDVNMLAKISLNTASLEEKGIDQTNKLDIFSKTISLDQLQDASNLHLEKTGQGTLHYDIAMNYQIPAGNVASRDEGFFVEQAYYDYDAYKVVKKAKDEEWARYVAGEIDYKDLRYPKDIVTYLKPIEQFSVGKLVYVSNRLITGETRDQVAFEGFIPSGSELVNPDLKTEDQQNQLSSFFEHEEWQDDRYFATISSLDAGVYNFGYIIRPTHSGTYQLLPSRAFEFYRPEVFGRIAGKVVKIVDGK